MFMPSPRAALTAATAAIALSGALVSGAANATCRQDVDQLAGEYHVGSPAAPAPLSGSSDTSLSTKLAESGGVIAPPPAGTAGDTVKPGNANPDNMPTAPAVPPQTDDGKLAPQASTGPETPPGIDPAKRSQLSEILTSARSSADRGDEQQCRRELDQAKQLVKQPG